MGELSGFSSVYENFLWNAIEEGNSILAEILRLSDFVPGDFIDPSSSKYKVFILDFTYFAKTTQYEKLISNDEDLQDTFYSVYGDILLRFEILFQTIANFVISLNEYCDQIGNDHLASIDFTRELEVETLYTLGLVLLYLDKYLPGLVRERIYVSIYRNSDERKNVEFLVDFLRVENANFPNDRLFERVKINNVFITNCLAYFDKGSSEGEISKRLRQKWAQMVYVCLNFQPNILNNGSSKMRQIVENFYREHWVLHLGVGLLVNLMDAWQPFRAAITALTSRIDLFKAKELARDHFNILVGLDIPQGKIAACDFGAHIRLIGRYNSSLRWLLLHTSVSNYGKKASTYMQATDVATHFDQKALVLMFKVANFEMEFLKTYRHYVRNKEQNVKKLIADTCSTISEIAEVFNQGISYSKISNRTKLHEWFLLIKKTVTELDVNNVENAEVVSQIKRRINQVCEMLDLGGNLAMGTYLQKLEVQLDSLAAVLSVKESEERAVEVAADPSYLWTMLDDWIPRIQQRILESSNIQPVRALFHKLSLSIFNICNNLHSDERKRLIGRAYSFHLEKKLRVILQSVPHRLFSILHDVVIPSLYREWTTSILKTEVKEMADFDENFRLSEATFIISNMSVGISRMALRRIGILEVNPKELLEEGIRHELSIELPKLFIVNSWNISLDDLLKKLTVSLCSFQRAFIYMCDHMDVNGQEIWREEVESALEKMAEDCFDKPKMSIIKKKKIGSSNALSAIIDLLQKASDPSLSRFVDNEMVWRDVKTKKETLSSETVDLIEKWIPCGAIGCMLRLLSAEAESILSEAIKLINTVTPLMDSVVVDDSFFRSKQFESLNKSIISIQPTLTNLILKLGQIALLRMMLSQSKQEHGRFRASPLFSALDACNGYLLSSSTLPSNIYSLALLLQECALYQPHRTVYGVPPLPRNSTLCLYLLLYNTTAKLNGSRRDSICKSSFLLGVFCLLNQGRGITELQSIVTHTSDSLYPKSDRSILADNVCCILSYA